MVSPDRDTISNNVAGNPAGDQTWEIDARNIMFRIDHNFTSNFRSSFSFYWNRRPSVRNCGEVAGCTVPNDPETQSALNTEYYGDGFFQRISTQHAHQQFDWIIKRQPADALDDRLRPLVHGREPPGGRRRLAAAALGGEQRRHRQHRCGPTGMTFGGNIPYNSIGANGWPAFGFLVNNRWQFSNDITWVKGRHSLKTGFEFRHHDFPFRGWAAGSTAGQFNFNRLGTAGFDASGNNLGQTGDPFASFLLGQVQDANQTLPSSPRSARPTRASG